MKIMKRMMGLAAAILALSACSESEDLLSAFHSDPNAVRITAEVGKASANGFTRSNPLGEGEAQKKFNENDEISVKADGQDAVTYQLNGTEWQPKESSKFLKWENDKMNFTAYYPASFDGNLDNITLPEKYDEASLAANDFMSFSEKQSNTNGNQLTLTMERKMARVVVEIAGFNDQYAGNTIDNVNSLSICGIKAYKHDNKFYALIKPCEAQSSATFISLDVAEGESKTTTEKLTGIPELTAGNSYTYQLKVGKNKISVSGITVANWNTGEITGGKAETDNTPYLTFTAGEEQTFEMSTPYIDPEIMPGYEPYKISGLQYSVNNGDWKDVGATGIRVTFGGNNGTLRLRGKNLKGTAKSEFEYSYISFGDNKVPVTCTGDIRTLLDHDSYKTVATDQARFCRLFMGCRAMATAPNLPAETLADKCYREMFSNCTNLVKAPELPAKILAADCYCGMFDGCTKLETAPNLQAINLVESCYSTMFRSCESLETAPALPAENLASSCYSFMFYGCTKLKSAPDLPAKNVASSCYSYMFYGCTSLVKALDLPAINMKIYCYYNMFAGCKSLESAPKLPATTLAQSCYDNMFNGCEKLSSVTMLAPSDQIEDIHYSFNSWLDGAGTSAATRTLKVKNADAYNALADNKYYLPSNSNWIKGTSGTTVKDENNKDI